jgi:hypothetical protein
MAERNIKHSKRPEDRLIVEYEIFPNNSHQGPSWIFDQFKEFVNEIQFTGVIISSRSALRACGYSIIQLCHENGLKFMADLRLCADTPDAFLKEGLLLRSSSPEILTVEYTGKNSGLHYLRECLPETEILGVAGPLNEVAVITHDTMPSSEKEQQSKNMLDGFVVSTQQDTEFFRHKFGKGGVTIVAHVSNAAYFPEQNKETEGIGNAMTLISAFKAGANHFIVGKDITKAQNPHDVLMRTLDDISMCLKYK